MVKNYTEDMTRQELRTLLSHISKIRNASALSNNWSLLNNLFRCIDVKSMSITEMLAWLRYTNWSNDHLPEWYIFLHRVRKEIAQREPENVDQLMMGLQ